MIVSWILEVDSEEVSRHVRCDEGEVTVELGTKRTERVLLQGSLSLGAYT